MTGNFFSWFIQGYFNITFAKAGPKTNGNRLFVMDNNLYQTSKKAMLAFTDTEVEVHCLPVRSPDLDLIENTFHVSKRRLDQQVLDMRIEHESFQQFKERVFRCCDDVDKGDKWSNDRKFTAKNSITHQGTRFSNEILKQ